MCYGNQLTGFYMMVTLAFKELIKNCLNSIYPSQFPYEMRKA